MQLGASVNSLHAFTAHSDDSAENAGDFPEQRWTAGTHATAAPADQNDDVETPTSGDPTGPTCAAAPGIAVAAKDRRDLRARQELAEVQRLRGDRLLI